jgi:uncharacterized protein (TIGR00730 family)
MKITVFGGSQTRPGDTLYEDARRLGNLLGQAGYTVLTGGYIGTMEAVSRGTVEAGGHTIGITCEEIERWRPGGPNAWVQEEWRLPTLRERMAALIENCDAAIALPGGPGTLAEISHMWNLLVIHAIPSRPLILIGPDWKATFDGFFARLGSYTPEHDRPLLTFALKIDDAVHLLNSGKP